MLMFSMATSNRSNCKNDSLKLHTVVTVFEEEHIGSETPDSQC